MALPGSLEFNLLVGDTLAVERADDGETDHKESSREKINF